MEITIDDLRINNITQLKEFLKGSQGFYLFYQKRSYHANDNALKEDYLRK